MLQRLLQTGAASSVTARTRWVVLAGMAILLSSAAGCGHDHPGETRMVVVESTTQPGHRSQAAGSMQPIRVIVDDASAPAAGDATIKSMIGRKSRVQFRRDALGLVADAPTPPLSEGLFKRPVYLDGTLSTAGSDGIVLRVETGDVWIPWTSILLIEARP